MRSLLFAFTIYTVKKQREWSQGDSGKATVIQEYHVMLPLMEFLQFVDPIAQPHRQ